MLCLPADLTSHAFNVSTAHPVGFENGREREREGGAGAPRRTGRMNREGEVCSLVTCGVHFGARRRARARRRCVPRQLRLSIRSSECCGTRKKSASSQRQRKSSRCQQRAHVCAVLRRFANTSLNGYQPLVVIPLVSTRMSAAAPGKTKRIVTTATHNGSIAVAGAQVSSTPSVSRVLFLSHTSNCGGRGRGGARSAARRGVRRVSEWAKALGFEVISPAS